MRYINKTLLLLILNFSALAVAQITTFSPGDPIKSAEINDNFSHLIAEIESLRFQIQALEASVSSGKAACTRSSLAGQWLAASVDSLNDYELNTAIFRSDGTVSFTAETEFLGFERAEGTYTIDSNCFIEGRGSFSLGDIDYFGWLSDDGNSIQGLVYRRLDGLWFSPLLTRYDR